MRPLIIDDQAKARAAQVVAYAQSNVRRIAELDEATKTGAAPGDEANFTCHILAGFKCVFTIDEVKEVGGLCRHLSVSVDGGKWPHEAAVQEIAKLFGISVQLFPTPVPGDWKLWLEKEVKAINLLQPIKT